EVHVVRAGRRQPGLAKELEPVEALSLVRPKRPLDSLRDVDFAEPLEAAELLCEGPQLLASAPTESSGAHGFVQLGEPRRVQDGQREPAALADRRPSIELRQSSEDGAKARRRNGEKPAVLQPDHQRAVLGQGVELLERKMRPRVAEQLEKDGKKAVAMAIDLDSHLEIELLLPLGWLHLGIPTDVALDDAERIGVVVLHLPPFGAQPRDLLHADPQ